MDRSASFMRVIRRLSDIDVIAFDRRGYAGSRALGAVDDLSRHVADGLAVTQGRPVIAIGHSFGGLVALGMAYQEPAIIGFHRNQAGFAIGEFHNL